MPDPQDRHFFMQWDFIPEFAEYDTAYQDVVIETMLCISRSLPLWRWHEHRASKTLAALCWGAIPAGIPDAVRTAVADLEAHKAWKVRWLTGRRNGRMEWGLQVAEVSSQESVALLAGTACIPGEKRAGLLMKSRNNLRAVWELRQALSLSPGTDIVLCNDHGYCMETTLANIFIIKGREIFTPPLQQHMVPGVMRQYLLEKQRWNNYEIIEKNIHFAAELLTAEEVFMTNAVRGVLPVGRVLEQTFDTERAAALKLTIDTELKTGNTIWQ